MNIYGNMLNSNFSNMNNINKRNKGNYQQFKLKDNNNCKLEYKPRHRNNNILPYKQKMNLDLSNN